MSEVSIIGLDIAKHVFQAHGADASGRAVLRKKLSRSKVLPFFASQPRCRVVLEACGGAHHWARELAKLGHDCAATTRMSGTASIRLSGWGSASGRA